MSVMLAARPHRFKWLQIDFLTLHYAYFIGTSLLLAIIFWGSGRDGYQISFVNSLFLTVSAMTEAGLNTVSLSKMNTFQQVILWLLIAIGSVPPVTFVLVYVRKRAFERRYGVAICEMLAEMEKSEKHTQSCSSSGVTMQRGGSQISNLSYEASARLFEEYKALKLLCWLIPAYFLSWQILGCIGLGAWIAVNSPGTALQNGFNPWWDGIFFAVSAFNNSGMSVQDENLVVFQNDAFLLMTVGLLILAGNTCYPVFLRAIIWSLWKCLPAKRFENTRSTLRFLLDHPRDVYTHLFPARNTWLLLLSVILLNSIDWAAFEVLNIHNPAVNTLPPVARVLDGLIQALAVRFGGFYVASISDLNIALLVLYVLMMYIGAFPVTMNMRSTNVYDSYYIAPQPEKDAPLFTKLLRNSLPASISHHISRQLSHDIWYLCISVLFIMIIESSAYKEDPVAFSVFNVIFEVVSAYGTVGISVGFPGANYSFCGSWHVLSKLILAIVCIRGRHRGLPDINDRAVMMPGAKLAEVSQVTIEAMESMATLSDSTVEAARSQEDLAKNDKDQKVKKNKESIDNMV